MVAASRVMIVAALVAGAAHAQAPGVSVGASLTQLSTPADDRLRLDQLVTTGNDPLWLLRSPSSMRTRGRADERFHLSLISPELAFVNNSALPHSMNDGPLWAGRGQSLQLTGGVSAEWGRVRLILAPQYWSSENRDFQVIQYLPQVDDGRSKWANPFHPLPSSIDLPYRLGDRKLSGLEAGQSSLTVELGGVNVGVGTENLWWGPGIRNAILLSNNAAGFPHAFARTRDGWRTRAGRFDAQWIVGTLRESDFFDSDSSNNTRSIGGLAVVWTPNADSGLSVGLARTVWANRTEAVPIAAAFDVLRDIGRPGADTSLRPAPGKADQILSLFARWVFPVAGVEAWAEWARFEIPGSFRDLLEYPQHSQAYTIGMQWARPVPLFDPDTRLRLQAEATYLEPDPAQRVRYVATTYTSNVVPQGYTNRGQSLGAAIGAGSSSQWVAADIFASRFSFGAYFERIRRDNATLWTKIVPEPKSEDLSLIAGVRGAVEWRGTQVSLEYGHDVRLDFMFQDRPNKDDPFHQGVDILNNSLALRISRAVRP